MIGLFQRLHARGFEERGGSVECSKVLMGRGSSATTGVEGFYVPGGVQMAHMFLLRPEGVGDVADMLLHFKVSFGYTSNYILFVPGVFPPSPSMTQVLFVSNKIGNGV